MTTAAVTNGRFTLKTALGFLGPAFLVTVGFIDPGNWATNIEGGSRFGYDLLWVITLGTIMLIVIQHMAAFRSSTREFAAAVVISATVIVLNVYLLYSTIAS